MIAGEHRSDRRGRRARPHIARADHDDEIGGVQRGLSGVGQTTRKVADHGDSPATAGVDDGVHRPGVQFVAAPGARQHADPPVSRQRLAHCRPGQPSALQRQIGPAQARAWSRRPPADRCRHPTDRGRPAVSRWQPAPGRPRTMTRPPRRAPDHRDDLAARPVVARRFTGFGELADQIHALARAASAHAGHRPSMAAAHVVVAGSAAVSTLTWARRGSAACPHRSAAASSSTTAAAADQVFLLTGRSRCRHGPPEHRRPRPPGPARRASPDRSAPPTRPRNPDGCVGGAVTRPPCGARRWDTSPKCGFVDRDASCAQSVSRRSPRTDGTIPATRSRQAEHRSTREFTPEKGRPPPGGEEARVVVYQPRGVGLIHPRLRPSNAYYTHDSTR